MIIPGNPRDESNRDAGQSVMSPARRSLTALTLALSSSLLAVSACERVESTPASLIEVLEAWTRMPAVAGPDASVAVYVTLVNTGPAMLVLTGITSPSAREGMLHETTRVGDIARMRPVSQVPIASGGRVTLRPGSLHGMLRGLDPIAAPGQAIPVELHFQDGSSVQVSVTVRAR